MKGIERQRKNKCADINLEHPFLEIAIAVVAIAFPRSLAHSHATTEMGEF